MYERKTVTMDIMHKTILEYEIQFWKIANVLLLLSIDISPIHDIFQYSDFLIHNFHRILGHQMIAPRDEGYQYYPSARPPTAGELLDVGDHEVPDNASPVTQG